MAPAPPPGGLTKIKFSLRNARANSRAAELAPQQAQQEEAVWQQEQAKLTMMELLDDEWRKVLYHLEDAESMQRKHEALLQQHSQISGRYALQPGQEVIFQKDLAFERSYQ